MDSENVSLTGALGLTPVAPIAGRLLDSVGGVTSGAGPVTTPNSYAAPSLLPERSAAAVDTVKVKPASGGSGSTCTQLRTFFAVGSSVHVPPASAGNEVTALMTVGPFIASLNVIVGVVVSETFVAPFAGETVCTVGAVTSVTV